MAQQFYPQAFPPPHQQQTFQQQPQVNGYPGPASAPRPVLPASYQAQAPQFAQQNGQQFAPPMPTGQFPRPPSQQGAPNAADVTSQMNKMTLRPELNDPSVNGANQLAGSVPPLPHNPFVPAPGFQQPRQTPNFPTQSLPGQGAPGPQYPGPPQVLQPPGQYALGNQPGPTAGPPGSHQQEPPSFGQMQYEQQPRPMASRYPQAPQQQGQHQPQMNQQQLGQPPMHQNHMGQPPMHPSQMNQQMQPGMRGFPPQQMQGPQAGQMGQPAYYQQQQAQQRLDPDAMPSVVQVVEDDQNKFNTGNNVIYQTAYPASLPPLVSTVGVNGSKIVADQGTARPNHLRCSMYKLPTTEDLLKTAGIPFCVTVKPFDEDEVDRHMTVPLSPSEIVRCNRCKAYMNPYMRFIDGGRRFQCALCRHITETPQTYFAHLDHTGQRLDKFDRPELFYGSYEFKATAEFCRNQILNCRRPHIVFAFELTVNSKPVIQQIAKNLPDIIRTNLPTDPVRYGTAPPMVGFLTYNSKIQVYDIANNGQAHVICDVANPFPPFTTFLVDPIQYADQIENFLSSLPDLYSDEELDTETVLGPVIEAALQTCQVDRSNFYTNADDGQAVNQNKDISQAIAVGKVYIFHCTLPTYGQDTVTPGRLKPRWTTSVDEVRKLLGTDKEKQILAPEPSKYYNNLAQKCLSDYGSGVELFLFPPPNGPYLDIATVSELVRLTGSGGIYKYYNEISDRFLTDLKYSLSSTFAFDAVMKVRTSTGIRPYEYFGNFYARTASDIEVAVINAGNSISVEFKYDDKLAEDDFMVIQIATLYTAISGERRVRIHNTGLAICNEVAEVYRYAECDTLMNYLLRQSISQLRLGEKTVQQIRETLIARTVTILTAYRKHCAQPNSSLGQLILPEALKLLPVYLTGALKCDAIDGGPEMLPDDKAYAQIRALSASVRASQITLYPKLLRIEYDESGESLRAATIRCSAQRLANQTGLCYIMENGFYLFVYIPTQNPVDGQAKFLKNVFGVDTVNHIHPENGVPELLTQESQFIQELLNSITVERRKSMKVYVVRQGVDQIENVFRSFLYEDTKTHVAMSGDSGRREVPSYVDLLCHLHKEIRAQLN
ncbi:Protein transport protein Sec24C [Halotydeus destructor]|nr:Protein transport protein Sec24C [Halotydeus destructor]